MQRNCSSIEQRLSDDIVKRDIGSFVEPAPPLFLHPFLRPRPKRIVKLMETYEEELDSELEQELVQVYLRLKPCNVSQNLYEVRSDQCLVTTLDTATAGHGRRTQHNVSRMYTFSHIFRSDATQQEVFEEVVKPNLQKLSEGHSFTLLTYGASGSGKTFTLMGTVASPGLVPRSLEYLFKNMSPETMPRIRPGENGAEQLSSLQQQKEIQWVKSLQNIAVPQRDKYRRMSVTLNNLTASSTDLSMQDRYYIWVSFVEIYNESVYDLLVSSNRGTASSKLRIREDNQGNVYVKGATQAFVRSGIEAYNVMVAGKHNLQVAATGVHAQSSRSHCIFTITLLCETESGVRTSCVRLCDLAGCERARNTKNTGARMQESRAINTSLHVLERCLHMLRNKNTGHVPYRESKLTRLLGAGLSGARSEAVSMVVTINPDPHHAMETRHVLQLAAIARDIQVNNTMATFESMDSTEHSTIDTTVTTSHEVLKLKSENERLHYELIQAQQKIKALEAQLEVNRKKASKLTMEVVEETRESTRKHYEQKYEDTVKRLRDELEELIEENIVLREKNNELQSSRELLKQEGEHLRACLDAISEQSESPTPEPVSVEESDGDPESDTEDPLNESLEPTFGKAAMREFKARLSLLPNKINIQQPDSTTDVFNEDEEGSDRNSPIDLESTKDTICNNDHDNSFKNDDSGMNVDESEQIDDTNYDSKPKTCERNLINKSGAVIVEVKLDTCNVSTSELNMQEGFDVTKEKPCDDSILEMNTEKTSEIAKDKSLDVTTYVRNSVVSIGNTDDIVSSNKIGEKSYNALIFNETNNNTKDNENLTISENKDHQHVAHSASKLLLSNVRGEDSHRLSRPEYRRQSTLESSLSQFEKLEIATRDGDDIVDKTGVSIVDFGILKVSKDKRHYFDETDVPKISLKPVSEENNKSSNKDPAVIIQKNDNLINDQKGTNKNVFKVINDSAVNESTERIKENSEIIKDASNESNTEDLITVSLKGKKYFDSPETCKEMSLSIFNDGIPKDFAQATTHKIYGDSICKEIRSIKKQQSLDIFDSPHLQLNSNEDSEQNKPECETEHIEKITEKEEHVKPKHTTLSESIEINELKLKALKTKILIEKAQNNKVNLEFKLPEPLSKNDRRDSLDDFEDIYKQITTPRPTEFEQLVNPNDSNVFVKVKEDKETEAENKVKYNLRHKTNTEEIENQKDDTKMNKKSLRLRRRKNQIEEKSDEEELKLKNIVNLQQEFSDVTLDVPAPVKEVKDIESPERNAEDGENVAPLGSQSCPMKSVTRSRRKLFTPRADPLDEDEEVGDVDSKEKIRVPRPSYHRTTRARRKL